MSELAAQHGAPSVPELDAAFVGVCNDTYGARLHRFGPEQKSLLTGPEAYGYSLVAQQRVDAAWQQRLEDIRRSLTMRRLRRARLNP